jgi:hypothetical protein
VIGGSVGTIAGMVTAGNQLYFSTEAALDWQIFTVNDSPVSTTTSTGTITGVVFNDIDHDGIRGETEPALAGYRVFLDADGDGICDSTEASVKSSSSGRYTFSSLPAGKYVVAQVTSPTRGPTTPTAYSVKLKSGQRVTRSFGNAGGILSGVVFLDINRNGYRNANEVTIPKAHVYIDLDNDGTWDANEPIVRTGSTGRYTFSDIAAGTWRIRLLPIPNMFFTAGDMRKVTLPVGARLTRNFGVLGG